MPFDYLAPRDLPDALRLLAEPEPDQKVLAGGQSLVPMMNLRLARPSRLIDLNRIPGLSEISERGGDLVVGAMARQSAVEDSTLVERLIPALHDAIGYVGHRPTRNRGTAGGSIVHADPSAEIPCVWLAHDGEIVLASERGARTLAAGEFFHTYFTTGIQPHEIATELLFKPVTGRSGWGFREVARRRGDFALLSITALVTVAPSGEVERARLVAGAAIDVPIRLAAAESALTGARLGEDTISDAADAAAAEIDPLNDSQAPDWYRRRLVRVLTSRALLDARARISPESDAA